MADILKLTSLSQEFGGLRALNNIDLTIEPEIIFGIIGPNGAGKTTLFNIISGIYAPTTGQMVFRGQQIHKYRAYEFARLGIARTFQNIRLFNKMSVIDNVKVGFHGVTQSTFLHSLLGLQKKQEQQITNEALKLLQLVELESKKMEFAENLSYGEQRRLEIARALALRPVLLLLDEPAAGMNPIEKQELMALIDKIKNERKITVLLVEHDMSLVMNICDRIAVLSYGSKIAEGSPIEIKYEPKVIESYLGLDI